MRALIVSVSLCVLVILLQDSILRVQSQPVQYSKLEEYEKSTGEKITYDHDNECKHGGKIRDLCERCAKVTKNELAYPLCCQEQKGVRSWCQEFLDYRPVEPIFHLESKSMTKTHPAWQLIPPRILFRKSSNQVGRH